MSEIYCTCGHVRGRHKKGIFKYVGCKDCRCICFNEKAGQREHWWS